MQLVITEKPSVAKSIAQVLHATEVKNGYLQGNGYLVSWCVGHLVELASADSYREEWKKWSYEQLPIIPDVWQYKVKESTRKQYEVLKTLLHAPQVAEVVCATDIEQREGRIIRQGNRNKKVHIFRYITEGTFDAYSWQVIENKQKFISQIMTSKSPVRSCEDIDEASLSYAEVKALATGNPYIKEKMDLDIQVSRLKLLKANHTSQIYRLQDNILKHYPKKISSTKELIAAYAVDIAHYREVKPADKDNFSMTLGDRTYTDKKEAGTALIAFCRQVKTPNQPVQIGEYLGFKMNVVYDTFYQKFTLNLKGALTHRIEVGSDAFGNLTRINNVLDGMEKSQAKEQELLANTEKQLENAKEEVEKPFAQEDELNEKLERLAELNALLNMDEKGTEECLDEPGDEENLPKENETGQSFGENPDLSVKNGTGQRTEENRPSIMGKLAYYQEQSQQTGLNTVRNREKAASL